ncbi:hypothetical protein C922_03643 [Plasmodium inui San Antonio 1]|uniref:Uncharacterized protein n=1 Tax=Plasmodium inui San Antonio 1 TaxID=1237626 RepID=W7A9U2_9APIC|nr:hypothetical protein C922_03643 [Plasmodium inui San Antonio 1]EUD65919.1 hypothetical protein C922_03643 [Plasmodium inui San Antonio 1]
MKDVKLLLEKLRISREKELEREVKIFLELKRLSDGTPKGDEQNAVATERDANGVTNPNGVNNSIGGNNSIGADTPDSYVNYLNYVKKKINNVRRKTVFEKSYYRNVLNCYDHSEHYKEVIKYTAHELQVTPQSELKKAILQRENLLTFYYAYLVRKHCERNFLKCVHNDFIRSLTYTYLEKNLFFNFLSANLCVLSRCIKCVEVLSEETSNENLTHLLNQCRDVILGVYRELATLRGKDKQIETAQLVVDPKESDDVFSSLVKYFPFLNEPSGKSSEGGENRHDAHMKDLYGVYAFIYVFSNVFYVSSLAVSRAKVGRHLPVTGMPNCYADNQLSGNVDKNTDIHFSNHLSGDLHRFAMYRMCIEQYAKGDFMELNETMLYFLSRERMAQKGDSRDSNHTWGDILHDLNALRNATALQSQFFAAIAAKPIIGDSPVHSNVNDAASDPPLLPCINHFFYIGIDFDKTIIKKDSYSAFFKILEKNYYKESVRPGKDTLTEEEIFFFDNFSLDKMQNKPEPTTQERIEWLHKMGQWFVLKEVAILEELKRDRENREEVYSESYYYYLNQVDKIHITYSMLLSYYDMFKDVDVDVLNGLISEHYERFQLNDYFLEVFLHLLNHKMENKDSFYFDIITLNLKKQICLYTIRNNLLKVKEGEGITLPLSPPSPWSKEGAPFQNREGAASQEDYYHTFKKYFHVYYSKTHTYDKGQRKYTGSFDYNRLKIKHGEYQPRRDGNDDGGKNPNGVIEKVSLCSFYDKTLIKTRVCSLLRHINHKLSAFIGDSLIDLDAMLHSDIAILVGHNELLISFCEKHNIVIKPLVCAAAKIELLTRRRGGLTTSMNGADRRITEASTSLNRATPSSNDATTDVTPTTNFTANKMAPLTEERDEELNDLYDEREKVIYSTESWLEIGIFFFGDV